MTFTSGGTVLGTAPVWHGVATLTLPAYQAVGAQTVTVEPRRDLGLRAVLGRRRVRRRQGDPAGRRRRPAGRDPQDDDAARGSTCTLTAPGQIVTGYVVVRQDGAVLGVEQLVDGHATITLPPYKKKGEETVSVEYLGSDLAEAVTTPVTFTVQN